MKNIISFFGLMDFEKPFGLTSAYLKEEECRNQEANSVHYLSCFTLSLFFALFAVLLFHCN